jgi:hypothetical protein
MNDRVARPPTQLKYLMWDGTDPVDSIKLAKGLASSFRCVNLLDSKTALQAGVLSSPRIFEPCGKKGEDLSDKLYIEGMFTFPRVFFAPSHSTGEFPAILQYSGHGIPGFMFAASTVLLAASRCMQGSVTTTGTTWSFVDDNWDNPNTKVVIFSACRQLAGKVQQFHWSNRMRGATNRVHIILGYRNTAPDAGTSAAINQAFVGGLANGQTFRDAWRAAHDGGLRRRWAALAYKSSVDDRMDKWVRTGALPAEPVAGEDILYFDEDNRAGRVVTTPKPDFSMAMQFDSGTPLFPPVAHGELVPPWTIFRPGAIVNLKLKFITDTFNDGDKLWIAALQVRPDYDGPFEITDLIQPVTFPDLVNNAAVDIFGRLHDESDGWKADTYTDLYELTIKRSGMTWATLDDPNSLTIPMKIVGRPNNHLPLYYLMVRIERGGREFGIPTDLKRGIRIANQTRLIDEAQFCVFLAFPPAT